MVHSSSKSEMNLRLKSCGLVLVRPAFLAPITMGSGRVCAPFDAAVPALILLEAPTDALSLTACGFPALALSGISGPHWLRLVCGLGRVALEFDAGEARDRAAVAVGEPR
jgi:hypothetical protein